MDDVKEIIVEMQKLISKADDFTRLNNAIDAKLQCELAIAHAYLDRYLNKIERLPRAA